MIKITLDKDPDLEVCTKGFLRRLADKVARARPDRGDTATLAYVTFRRAMAKNELATSSFELHMSNDAARNMRKELAQYLRSLEDRQTVPPYFLTTFLAKLKDALAQQREEMNASARSNRRAAARGSASSVRQQRRFR